MTATLDGVAKMKAGEQSAEHQAAVELVRMAREQGLSLTGPDGLLKQLAGTFEPQIVKKRQGVRVRLAVAVSPPRLCTPG